MAGRRYCRHSWTQVKVNGWRRSASTFVPGDVVRAYLIPSLDRSHAGFYRCIVRNRVGALLQRRTEVQVACKYPHGMVQGLTREGQLLAG
ncbi:Protein sidekick-2 [Liparis tanakae]|uniref:Protein sidekick-2 n=1 Tax=Liparis tanakae TaxID=230148 RepID=A0A4Z2F4M0_9TELE|nr:Protein sidekick-2 [Liparis tanakae]